MLDGKQKPDTSVRKSVDELDDWSSQDDELLDARPTGPYDVTRKLWIDAWTNGCNAHSSGTSWLDMACTTMGKSRALDTQDHSTDVQHRGQIVTYALG